MSTGAFGPSTESPRENRRVKVQVERFIHASVHLQKGGGFHEDRGHDKLAS